MKREKSFYLILFLLNLPLFAIAQEVGKDVVVAATDMNVLYFGITNPIEIAVTGVTSDKVTATITNGAIKRVSNGWAVIPDKIGISTITVLVDNKKVSEKEFRVKSIPTPVATFAGKNNGALLKDVALETEVIEAEIPDFLPDLKFKIVSFTFLVTKDDTDYEEKSNGNKLTDNMKSLMSGLVSGNSFFFKDIKAQSPDGKIVALAPLILKVN
jgi:gliding motility-associated protein GldM